MNQQPIRILAIFDYNSFTGFGSVSKNLVNNWKKIFGERLFLDIVAVNYFGEDYTEGTNIRVISAKKKDIAKDDFGRYVFLSSLRAEDYDLIYILQDLGIICPVVKFLKEIKEEKRKANRKQFKSIFYFPVDCALTPNLSQGLEFFDSLATYTEYGRQQVYLIRPDLKGKVKVVPHGNNMEHFHPLPESDVKAFKKSYFGKNADKFIVGCVNRNQPRKDIPTTIFGFMEYWEEHNSNALLYLHMHPKDPMGWNLRNVLGQTPLKEGEHFMFPSEEEYNKGADLAKMNLIYNSFDVFLTTATGGGWELTATEAMACKKPTILPKHTSFQHLGGAAGERTYFLETLYPIVSTADNIIRYQSDLYEIAETLNLVKGHIDSGSEELKGKVEKAYKFVESLDWKEIAKTFSDEIKRLA